MKKFFDWLKFWLWVFMFILLGAFVLKADWTSTNPGTTDSNLFINWSWTLTKDKWNGLVNKVDSITWTVSSTLYYYCTNAATTTPCVNAKTWWAANSTYRAISCSNATWWNWYVFWTIRWDGSQRQFWAWSRNNCDNWTTVVAKIK